MKTGPLFLLLNCHTWSVEPRVCIFPTIQHLCSSFYLPGPAQASLAVPLQPCFWVGVCLMLELPHARPLSSPLCAWPLRCHSCLKPGYDHPRPGSHKPAIEEKGLFLAPQLPREGGQSCWPEPLTLRPVYLLLLLEREKGEHRLWGDTGLGSNPSCSI